MNKKENSLAIVISIALLLLAVVGGTYAYFSTVAQIEEQSLYVQTSNPYGLIYNGSGLLSLENAIPGSRTEVKGFTIENPGAMNQAYTLSLHVDENGFTKVHTQNLSDPNDTGDNDNAINQLVAYVGYGNCVVDNAIDAEVPLSCDTMMQFDLTDGVNSRGAGTDIPIFDVLIEPNEVQSFQVYIEFKDIGANQDENKNKGFGGHIALTDSVLVKNEQLPYNGLTLSNKVRRSVNPNHLNRVVQYLNTFASSYQPRGEINQINSNTFANMTINSNSNIINSKIDSIIESINIQGNKDIAFGFSFDTGAGIQFGLNQTGLSLSVNNSNYDNIYYNYSGGYGLDVNKWVRWDGDANQYLPVTDEELADFVSNGGFEYMSACVFYFPTEYRVNDNIKKILEFYEIMYNVILTVPDDLEIGEPSDDNFNVLLHISDYETYHDIEIDENNSYLSPIAWNGSENAVDYTQKYYIANNIARVPYGDYAIILNSNDYYFNSFIYNVNSNLEIWKYGLLKSNTVVAHLDPQVPYDYYNKPFEFYFNVTRRSPNDDTAYFDNVRLYNFNHTQYPIMYLLKNQSYYMDGYDNTNIQEFDVGDSDFKLTYTIGVDEAPTITPWNE